MIITTNTVLFDLDGTLFNSRLFAQKFTAAFAPILGISTQASRQTLSDFLSSLESRTDFSIQGYTAYLSTQYSVDAQELKDIFYNSKELYNDSLFPEVPTVLERLAFTNKLGIYSEGNYEHQLHKITNTGISKYFDPQLIFIFKRKWIPQAIEKLPLQSTIIDDKPYIAEELVKKFNVILINRGSLDIHPTIPTIHTLTELSSEL